MCYIATAFLFNSIYAYPWRSLCSRPRQSDMGTLVQYVCGVNHIATACISLGHTCIPISLSTQCTVVVGPGSLTWAPLSCVGEAPHNTPASIHFFLLPSGPPSARPRSCHQFTGTSRARSGIPIGSSATGTRLPPQYVHAPIRVTCSHQDPSRGLGTGTERA
jgi:hypothetical protein